MKFKILIILVILFNIIAILFISKELFRFLSSDAKYINDLFINQESVNENKSDNMETKDKGRVSTKSADQKTLEYDLEIPPCAIEDCDFENY